MKPNIQWKILEILKNDIRLGLNPPAHLYQQHPITADDGQHFFRSIYETLFWAYGENGQQDSIYDMLDQLAANIASHPREMSMSDLVAGWALISNLTAKAEIYQRCKESISKGAPTNSLAFGEALLNLVWGFWIFEDPLFQNGARGLAKYAQEKQNHSNGKYKAFLPVDGVESLYGVAVSMYAFTVGARTEPDFFGWKRFFKDRTAYMCNLIKQEGIIDWDNGIVKSYTTDGKLDEDRRWDVWEGSRGLIGAAIAGAEPPSVCHDWAIKINDKQKLLLDKDGRPLLSDQNLTAYGSYYEATQVFGPPVS